MANIKGILLAASLMAAASESRNYGHDDRVYVSSEPNWKRKKCKSCKLLSKYTSRCDAGNRVSPNHQACEQYKKRK